MNLALLVCVRPTLDYRSPFKRVPPGLWRVKFNSNYTSRILVEELGAAISILSQDFTDGFEFEGGRSISLSFIHVNKDDGELTISLEKINGLNSAKSS